MSDHQDARRVSLDIAALLDEKAAPDESEHERRADEAATLGLAREHLQQQILLTEDQITSLQDDVWPALISSSSPLLHYFFFPQALTCASC